MSQNYKAAVDIMQEAGKIMKLGEERGFHTELGKTYIKSAELAIASAQVYATLALVTEQHTANLISAHRGGWLDGSAKLGTEIRSRLDR